MYLDRSPARPINRPINRSPARPINLRIFASSHLRTFAHFLHSLLRQWIQVTHAHWLRRHPSHNYVCRKLCWITMSPPPSDHGDIATMCFEEYIVESYFAFLFISVTGYGTSFPSAYLNWLWRLIPCLPHMELGMATVAMCDLRITFRHIFLCVALHMSTGYSGYRDGDC